VLIEGAANTELFEIYIEQILAPTLKKGQIVVMDNLSIHKSQKVRQLDHFESGDRVIQQVNDYQREVFNGDLGTIARIDLEEQEVIVQFAERDMTYDYADLSELALAWAVTVHKSQGSEYPVVILPLFMQHTCFSLATCFIQGSLAPSNWPSWWDQRRRLVWRSTV